MSLKSPKYHNRITKNKRNCIREIIAVLLLFTSISVAFNGNTAIRFSFHAISSCVVFCSMNGAQEISVGFLIQMF